MKAKIAIRFDGRFIIMGSYTDAMHAWEHYKGYPNSQLTKVWETSDVASVPLSDIVGRLGDSWYIKRA